MTASPNQGGIPGTASFEPQSQYRPQLREMRVSWLTPAAICGLRRSPRSKTKSARFSPIRRCAEYSPHPALAGEFEPKFEAADLVNLPNHQIYLKLMIDGAPSQPFSAETMRPGDVGRGIP
jgi:hypothetical protein